MIEAGTYKGKATNVEFAEKTYQGDTKVMIMVTFDAWADESDAAEPFELVWTGYFTDKAKNITFAQLKELGFEGPHQDVTSVTLAHLSKVVDLTVKYTTYQGEEQMRVGIKTPFVGEKAKKATLDKLSASLGGKPAAAAPKWKDEPAPVADKDLPFS